MFIFGLSSIIKERFNEEYISKKFDVYDVQICGYVDICDVLETGDTYLNTVCTFLCTAVKLSSAL